MAAINEESVQEIAAEGQEVELTPEQKKEQLDKLMAEGKSDHSAGNFETAIQKFGEAAEFAKKHYGPLAVESFEPNFMYGRALVEVSAAAKKNEENEEKKETEETEEESKEEKTDEDTKKEKNVLASEALEVASKIADKMIEETSSADWEKKKEELVLITKDLKERAGDSKGSQELVEEMTKLAEEKTETPEEKTETPEEKIVASEKKIDTPSVLTASNVNCDSAAKEVSSPVRAKRALEELVSEDAPSEKKAKSEEEMGDENVAVPAV